VRPSRYASAIVAFLLSCASVPESVTSWVEAPNSVPVGEAFIIRAHVHNASEQPVVLRQFDIGEAYLEGVIVDRTTPMFTELFKVWGLATYGFDRQVAPGEHFVVEISAQALKVGVFQGDFHLCVNSSVNCSFLTITTQIVSDE
jgi:hypothetical protein